MVNVGTARAWRSASVVSATLALAACANGGASPWPSPDSEVYGYIIDDAISAEVSQAQLDELRTYADGRTIPFSVIEEATQRTFACFESAGLEYSYEVVEYRGKLPNYEYRWNGDKAGLSSDQTRDVGNACSFGESQYIEAMYNNQPAALQLIDETFEAMKPDLIACLAEFGVLVGDDATRQEVASAATSLLRDGIVQEPTCIPPS